jgi:hypothetical protein
MVGVGLFEGVKLVAGVGLDEGIKLPVAVGIGKVGVELESEVGVGLGSGVWLRVAVGAADVEVGVEEPDPGVTVRALTIQAESDPPASENSSDNEPPDTETIKVFTAKPPTAVFTFARTVVPLAFTTMSSWA